MGGVCWHMATSDGRNDAAWSARSEAEAAADDDPSRIGILEATYRLLEDRGYPSVTTDEIAAAARVSKATIYRHWRSKQALVVNAVRMHLARIEAPDLGSFTADITWVLEQRLEDYRHPGTLRLVGGLVGAAANDPTLRPVFVEWVEHLNGVIRLAVQRGIARGDVEESIDLLALETLIAGIIARAVIAQHSFTVGSVEQMGALIGKAAAPG